MTDTMRAIEITKAGGPEVLQPTDRPMPQPAHGQVVIKVAYAGVNRPDALQRAGMYAPPPTASDLPGLEASGEVFAVGEGVSGLAVGDKVCALLPGGGYAEYVATPAAHCLPVPKGMSMKEAACLPETFFTVWSCAKLGAEAAINYRDTDFVDVLKAEGGADLILDMVGGDYIPRNLQALAEDGRLVQIAFLSGPKVEVNFATLMTRRLTMTGSTLRPQSDLAKAKIAEELREKVWPLLDAGKISPVMDSEYAFENASEAHARMETSGHIGKIVLKVDANA